MKITKLPNKYKIVKPFKVTKTEDYRYVPVGNAFYRKETYSYYEIKELDLHTNSENWEDAKEELMFDIYHLYHVCCECPKEKLGEKPLQWRKILKKHIKVMF